MGRKSNTDERRAQIVQALQQEMAATGYERASIKSIAVRAGLTSGLVHYHFKSKEDVLLALIDGLIAQADAGFELILASRASAANKLAAFVSSRVGLGAHADAAQVKAWVCILAETMGQPKVRSRMARWIDSDHARLEALLRANADTEPREKAAAVMAAIIGSFSLHAVHAKGIPPGYAEKQILKMLG